MFESSINKYFSSPTNIKLNDNKDFTVKSDEEECEIKKDRRVKIINNNNETVTMSSPEIIRCNEEVKEEVEYEALSIIKELNKQLLICQKEIAHKDEELAQRNEEIKHLKNYEIHYDDLARQVSILQDKLKLYETESDMINSKIKSCYQEENKSKSEMIDKEKVLNKYRNIMNEQERIISDLRREIETRKRSHKSLKKEFKEISSKFSTISHNITNKEGDLKLFQEENEDKLRKHEREKMKYDEKIKDLLEIIKTQKMEMEDHKYKLKHLNNERKTLLRNITNVQNTLNEEKKLNEEINEQLRIVNDLNKKFDETSGIILNLQSALEEEKRKNYELTLLSESLNEKLNALKHKYSGENSLEHLNVIIQNKNSDLDKLKRSLDELKKNQVSLEVRNKQYDNEMKDLIFGLNLEVNNLQQWVENYLGMYYANKDIEIPELPCTVTKSCRYKIKLDTLKESIYNVHLRLIKEFEKNHELLKKVNNETTKVNHKEDELTTEITELKNEILHKDNDLYMLNAKIDNLSQELLHFKDVCDNKSYELEGKTEKFNTFCEKIHLLLKEQVLKIQNIPVIVNNKIFSDVILKLNFTENIYDLINENLIKIIKVLDRIIKEYEEQCKEKDQVDLVLKNNGIKDKLINEKIILYENQLKKKEESVNSLKSELEKMKVNQLIENSLMESIRVPEIKEKALACSSQNKEAFHVKSSENNNNVNYSYSNTLKSETLMTFQGNCETQNSKESSKRKDLNTKSKKKIKTSNIFQENDILKSIMNYNYNLPSNLSNNI